MKFLLLMMVLCISLLFAGCNNIRIVDKSSTTTTTIKTVKEKGKPDVIVKVIVLVINDIITINTGFTVGTQGLGTYYFSVLRDLKFM